MARQLRGVRRVDKVLRVQRRCFHRQARVRRQVLARRLRRDLPQLECRKRFHPKNRMRRLAFRRRLQRRIVPILVKLIRVGQQAIEIRLVLVRFGCSGLLSIRFVFR